MSTWVTGGRDIKDEQLVLTDSGHEKGVNPVIILVLKLISILDCVILVAV